MGQYYKIIAKNTETNEIFYNARVLKDYQEYINEMNDMDCFEREWLDEHIYWVISQYCDLDDLDGELIDEIAENLEDEDNVTDEKNNPLCSRDIDKHRDI